MGGDGQGIVDNPETRQIVESFVRTDGGIGLGEAHDRLQLLLGRRYDGAGWGKLLDSLHAEPGSEPLMTLQEAFEFFGQLGGGSNVGGPTENRYRRIEGDHY